MNAEEAMKQAVRDHVAAGGDPFTPPRGVFRCDLDWLGHGLNEAMRLFGQTTRTDMAMPILPDDVLTQSDEGRKK